MIINGQEYLLENSVNLLTYLQEKGYALDKIAIELNGNIIPKARYAKTVLNPQDKLEIVTFVGGG